MPDPPSACLHCGSPLPHRPVQDSFCCNGCAAVHHLIAGAGLDRFYDLRGPGIPPVSPAVFRPHDFSWLETLPPSDPGGSPVPKPQSTIRNHQSEASLLLELQGISCLGCVWLIETLFHREPGAVRIDLRPQTGQMEWTYIPGQFSPVSFARTLLSFGYQVGPASGQRRSESSRLISRLGLCGAFAMNAMLFTLPRYLGMEPGFELAPLFSLLTFGFATLALLVGGVYFFRRAWTALRAGLLHIDLPIALGLAAAWLGSLGGWLLGYEPLLYFDFVAIFTFLMLVGRWTQEWALERNRLALLSSQPSAQTVLASDPTPSPISNLQSPIPSDPTPSQISNLKSQIPFSALTPGLLLHLPPGATVPVASTLLSPAETLLSLESITGESEPVPRTAGQTLPGGARLLGSEPVQARTEEAWAGSLAARLQAETEREPYRDVRYEKILRAYLLIVLLLAAFALLLWAFPGRDPLRGLQAAISLLVVSCPCALGVALPLAHELAVARLRRHGVYLRNPETWTRLRSVRHILFDKTGTLTFAVPRLTNPEVLATLSHDTLRALYLLAHSSLHPVSRALRESLLARQPTLASLPPLPASAVTETPGLGLSASFDGATWFLGKPSPHPEPPPRDPSGSPAPNPLPQRDPGGSPAPSPPRAVLTRDGIPVASFHLEEDLRTGASTEIAGLSRQGYTVAILSGDHPARVSRLASSLGLDPAHALGGLSPAAKAAWIQAHAPHSALMVGDGLNDALAFQSAVCTGTPVVDRGLLEHRADFYFLGRGLDAIRHLLAAARTRQSAARTVFTFALAYNAAAAAAALAGLMNPLLAAVLMPLSSLLTLGLTLLHHQRGQPNVS